MSITQPFGNSVIPHTSPSRGTSHEIADDGCCESSEFPANQSVGMEC